MWQTRRQTASLPLLWEPRSGDRPDGTSLRPDPLCSALPTTLIHGCNTDSASAHPGRRRNKWVSPPPPPLLKQTGLQSALEPNPEQMLGSSLWKLGWIFCQPHCGHTKWMCHWGSFLRHRNCFYIINRIKGTFKLMWSLWRMCLCVNFCEINFIKRLIYVFNFFNEKVVYELFYVAMFILFAS